MAETVKLRTRDLDGSLQTLEVNPEISPNDLMWNGSLDHYLESGRSALECIRTAMSIAGTDDAHKILDFPSGWGRQTRILLVAFPTAQITACDVNTDAVDFCAGTFGATAVYSREDPHEISIDERFDLIWSGSLLTHLDEERCLGFMRLFASLLEPGGLLVFTVTGRKHLRLDMETKAGFPEEENARLRADYQTTGFGYADYPGRAGWGVALAAPWRVTQWVGRFPELRLISYTEAGWHAHNDVVACIRESVAD